MKKYTAWINKWLLTHDPVGKCQSATIEMQNKFPELVRIRGHYFDVAWGERQHWWLKTNTGSIIDPTASQFPTKGNGYYDELDENCEEPVGKCMQCGALCYPSEGGSSYSCSESCASELGFNLNSQCNLS